MSAEPYIETNLETQLIELPTTEARAWNYSQMNPNDILEVAAQGREDPEVLFRAAQYGMETVDWRLRAKWQGVLLAVIGPSFDY